MAKNIRIRSGALVISGMLLAVGLAAAPGARGAGACDRECLKGLMNQYLSALVAHDPSRLPTTPSVKYTENTNRMALGDGLWQTVDSLGTFKLYVEDPESGQAVFYGTVEENGVAALLGVRLRERDRRVSELEALVVRQASGIHGSFDALKSAAPIWEDAVPAAERGSRQALIHDADQYFNGIVQGDGNIVPFADDCIRIENGGQTAPTPATATHPSMSARAQFNSKRFNYIHEITDRRFLLVDPQRGIVVAFVMFQHPGDIKVPVPAQSGAHPRRFSLASYPNTTQIMETFKIRGGKIQRIFAYIGLMPYRQRPGWPVGVTR
jgi:hypothetical protein